MMLAGFDVMSMEYIPGVQENTSSPALTRTLVLL
jgi:hypothetical protein